MSAAVAFLLIRLVLAALLLAVLVMILVYLRQGLRPIPTPGTHPPMAHLVSITDGVAPWALAGVNTIGRSPGNTFIIDHPSVSSYHARLSYGSGNWMLEDLGSRNGTRLNGLGVSEPVAITYGDLVQFGGAGFRLEAGSPEGSRSRAAEATEEVPSVNAADSSHSDGGELERRQS